MRVSTLPSALTLDRILEAQRMLDAQEVPLPNFMWFNEAYLGPQMIALANAIDRDITTALHNNPDYWALVRKVALQNP